MHLAFLFVAIILFVLDALSYWVQNPWSGRMTPLGLAFFAASFAAP